MEIETETKYLSAALIMFLFLLLFTLKPSSSIVTANNLTDTSLTVTPSEYQVMLISSLATLNVETHTYVLHVFDCSEFTKLLKSQLSNFSISSQCIAGYIYTPYKLFSHTWLEVTLLNSSKIEVETTNGQIINGEDYKKYHVITKGLCW